MVAPYGPEALVRLGSFVEAAGTLPNSLFAHATPYLPAAIAADANYFGFARKKLRRGDLILCSAGFSDPAATICLYRIVSVGPDDSLPDVAHSGGAVAFVP